MTETDLIAEVARLRLRIAELYDENENLSAHVESLGMALAEATVYRPTDDPDDLWGNQGST